MLKEIENENLLGKFLTNNIDDFHLVLKEACLPKKRPDKNNEDSIRFALECVLVTANLHEIENSNSSQMSIEKLSENAKLAIIYGLIHPSSDIRNRALFTTKSLSNIYNDLILYLIEKLKSVIILENQLSGSFSKRFKINREKSKSITISFFSLLVLLICNNVNENSKKLVDYLVNSLTGDVEDNNDDEFIEQFNQNTGAIILSAAKIISPGWVSVVLDLPVISQIASKISMPLTKKIVKLKEPSLKINVREFLIDSYTKKGYPCNILEMENFLYENTHKAQKLSERIANIYKTTVFNNETGDEIFNIAQTENGLVSWYLYTVYPFFFNVASKHNEILDNISTLFESGNPQSKYIAISALWFSRKYKLSEFEIVNTLGAVEKLFDDFSYRYILNYGGWIDFSHSKDEYLEFEYCKKSIEYLSSGQSQNYFIDERNEFLKLRYVGSVVKHYFRFLVEKKREDEIIKVIYSTVNNAASVSKKYNFSHQSFIIHSIDCLGEIGEVYPEASLRILLGFWSGGNNDPAIYSNVLQKTNEGEILQHVAKTINKIGRMYPSVAKKEISAAPKPQQSDLLNLMNKKLNESISFSISKEGQEVYQILLLNEKIRTVFANGIEKSGKSKNIEEFFDQYIELFFEFLKNTKDKNRSVKLTS